MIKIQEAISYLEEQFPLALQYDWDNSGLQVGDPEQELTGIMVAIDTTEAVLEEAMEQGCNLVVTHHPLLFNGLKKISTRTYVERCVQKALRHDIVIYAAHTNLDNSPKGVNAYWAERMGLKNIRALEPLRGHYYKVVTYVPDKAADKVRLALLQAEVGKQGAYDGTSFSTTGEGRFRALPGAEPYTGEVGEWHIEPEVMVSVLCAKEELPRALSAIRQSHPYEEPAIDVVPILYQEDRLGGGVIGDLPEALSVEKLFGLMKEWQPIGNIAHSKILKDPVKRVAYGGGACRDFMSHAAALGADIFITGEAKYNDYYDAADIITLATIGHYESELLTEEILYNTLSQKSGKFAAKRASSSQNPITYR